MIPGWNSKRPLGGQPARPGGAGSVWRLGPGPASLEAQFRVGSGCSFGWNSALAAKPVANPPAGGGGVLAQGPSRCFLSLLQQLSRALPSQHPPAPPHTPSPWGPTCHPPVPSSTCRFPFSNPPYAYGNFFEKETSDYCSKWKIRITCYN